MGLNLITFKKPLGGADFDVDHDYDVGFPHFGPDENLLNAMLDIGAKDGPFISFDEGRLELLIKVCKSIDDGTIQSDKDYAKRYSNETMLEFYQRWHKIINGLVNARYEVDWKTEHFVVYISC